jgi:NADH-quinone oxidoreductase subunit E
MNFTLKTVNCLGACALGPIVEIDGKYYGHMNTTKVESILKKYSTKIKE